MIHVVGEGSRSARISTLDVFISVFSRGKFVGSDLSG